MICQIRGRVLKKGSASLIIDVNNICYEVLVPQIIMKRIDENLDADGQIRLFTYHYSQVEPSRSVPVLIGFLNEIEREFFESFISVSGIGCKAAIRALSIPISMIARAIDEGDIGILRSLPGIGPQRAKEIVAKLQGKVGRFGLVQDKIKGTVTEPEPDFQKEALEVLKQLQYKAGEAKEMVLRALERSPNINSVEELLNEVYRQRTMK